LGYIRKFLRGETAEMTGGADIGDVFDGEIVLYSFKPPTKCTLVLM